MAKPVIEYDFNHPKWIKKAKRTFTMFDMNSKDGRVDYQDFTSMLRDVAAICKPSKAELENAYRILEKIANEIGIGPNDMGQNLEEWIEGTRKFGTAELAREARGEPMMFKMFHNALFDIVDTNKNGTIDLGELTVMCQAHAKVDDAKCKIAFDKIDKNKDGVISRKEFVDTYFENFFSINDIDLFGDNYDI